MATYPLPPAELIARERIRFLHSGYPAPNTLLSLPRVDRIPAATTFGVHYGTALLACQIIAGNAFEHGYLTLDQAGQELVDLEFNDVLTENVYYLRVKDGPDQYPIVPSFQDWVFPHGSIPESWPEVSTVYPSPARCGISNFSFAIDATHLVPKEEALWYQKNDMGRYGAAVVSNISDLANILSLKADLHRCFDTRWFAIIPKVTETTTSHVSQYVTHVLTQDAAELWPAYHNIVVQYLHPNARPFLFARFAWAILLHVKPFVTSNLPRYVIRVYTGNQGKTEYKTELLNEQELQDYYGGGGSKAATQIEKRGRTDTEADSEGSMDDGWEDTLNWWSDPGNRTRKQMSSESVVEEDNQAQKLAELKTKLAEVLPGDDEELLAV